ASPCRSGHCCPCDVARSVPPRRAVGGVRAPIDRAVRALLVEDDDAIAEFVSRGLREAGFAVDRHSDGENGLSAAIAQQYDVAIVDLMLPRRDGLSMIEELRRRTVSTPV